LTQPLVVGRIPSIERSRGPDEALPFGVKHWIKVEAVALLHEALTPGAVPGPVRAAEDRLVLQRAYFVLNVCRSGTTDSMDAIFIPAHPSHLICC